MMYKLKLVESKRKTMLSIDIYKWKEYTLKITKLKISNDFPSYIFETNFKEPVPSFFPIDNECFVSVESDMLNINNLESYITKLRECAELAEEVKERRKEFEERISDV